MKPLHTESTTPPVFVAFAIAGGVLFLLGGVLTAMTPDDRAILVIGMIAFLLLGAYTLLQVLRANRLIEDNRDLAGAVEDATARERNLRSRLAVTVREPVVAVVTFADRLADDGDLAGDERRAMIAELRASAHEVDRILADVADGDLATSGSRVTGVVRLDEELASVAASTISDVEFESWLEPARAWADAAIVRQALRSVIGGVRTSGCDSIVLKTDARHDRVVATVSGRCELLPRTGIETLTDTGSTVPDDDWHRALRSARDAITAMGGSISATEALGVSHIIVELPAAPTDIRAERPRPRPASRLPSLIEDPASSLAMAVDLRPERPTASLRFD